MAASGGTLTWSTTSISLAVGETKTVNYTTTFNHVDSSYFAPLIESVATFTDGTDKIDLTGTAAGTVTIAAGTAVAFETVTTNALTITVTAPVEDQNFLNERGLTHFWENIDNIKQDKLTAVTAEEIADVSTIDVSALLARIYPVGSIYMSATISTASLVNATLGGTWVSWGAGRVPVGVNSSDSDFSTVEKAGGEKTHTLTTNEMPSHTHKVINYTNGYTGGSQSGSKTVLTGTANQSDIDAAKAAGGGAAHNNLQPYITCYMYKRVA